MRLAFIFGPMSAGSRPFDFERIEDDPRGLTGTDNSFLGYASAMAARGHDVTIFASLQRFSTTWRGCSVRPYEERRAVDGGWDAALSWNDIAPLGDVAPSVLRVLDLQVNDFTYTRPQQHEAVDLYVAPSAPLARRLETMTPAPKPWRVVPNGCDPGAYTEGVKVPGRCIYASSADRGLHVVLEQWPRIRSAVPHAELRVFYHSLKLWFSQIPLTEKSAEWNQREQGRRAKIVRDLLPKLEGQGVQVVGSVSRRQMAREYSEAEVLAFPVDTVSFTEGFAVAILEGCASGAVPVITDCDAIGEIYAGACPMVAVRDRCDRFLDKERARTWSDTVIDVLRGEREPWESRGRAFAERHAWPVLGQHLEAVLTEALEAQR